MKKLSQNDENRMLDTINAVMSKCASGADPSQAVADMSLQQNLSSEEAARVCEAVNKIASISYLSRNEGNRDASFPLADSKEVVQMMKDSRKIAADPFKFRKTASEGLHELTTADKLAMLANSTKPEGVDPRWAYSASWEDLQAKSQALKIAADETRLMALKLEDSFEDIARRFDAMPKEAAEDAARYAMCVYGADGERFLNALENVGVDPIERINRPFVKTGSDIENRIDKFMTDTDNYLALKLATGFFDNSVKTAGIDDEIYAEYKRRTGIKGLPDTPTPQIMQEKDWQDARNDVIKGYEDREKNNNTYLNARFNETMNNTYRGASPEHPVNYLLQRRIDKVMDERADREYELARRQKELFSSAASNASNSSKETADFVTGMLSDAVNNTKTLLRGTIDRMKELDAIREKLQPIERSGNEYSDPLSLKATKYLDNLDLHDAFAKAYLSDPYLRQYPPQEVAEAFNIVHEVAPDLIRKNQSPHIISAMLRKYLANNSQIDPLEIKDLTSTEKDRKNIELMDLQIRNAKRNKPTTVK